MYNLLISRADMFHSNALNIIILNQLLNRVLWQSTKTVKNDTLVWSQTHGEGFHRDYFLFPQT